ncbi:serine/threonine-protein kinase [Nocardia acidivorans]|uniref:serine/threonine-protein kinase n=1 Tax=Nocardia acidivorans TaxID=404580 RepID=UPI00083789F1|nr:serine/threonine-protein kinase [Nocardia acidivorans]
MAALPVPGEIFAGYRIERVLGRGERGRVYLAAHPRLPRRDVLKVLPPSEDFEFTARFAREAELVAGLEHPNIVRVYDRGVERGCLWLAMGFIDGVDAAELIRRNPEGVPPAQAVRIITEVARGLDAAHHNGLLHRDVKPANILLETRSGETDLAYISDFGVARSMAESEALTEAGAVLATLDYAAPELLAGETVDERVDVYALGCTIFELLTGTVPFPACSPAAQIRAQLNAPPPRASERNPQLPRAIDAVIARALAKSPQRRYPSAGALARAAATALDPAALRRTRRRGRLLAALAAAAVIAVFVTGALAWQRDWFAHSPSALSTTLTTGSATPVATTDGTRSWGSYEFVVRAFATLLPPTPLASGYQALRCVPVNAHRGDVKITAPLGEVASMRCNGNGTPLVWLFVDCNVDRTPRSLDVAGEESIQGDRLWSRTSGSGRLVWGTGIAVETGRGEDADGMPTGKLHIAFDDAARSFCTLDAWGGATGQDLVDTWWPTAPL